ncbi:ribonuclease HII [Deltaproteobacteria bacterium]|nr:ribonuclease HII [Deltaproteobacteria bacterium]
MRILGLDEAGRGCVLGPLLVGAFCFEGEDQSPLRAAGAADSKAISAHKREVALARLQTLGQVRTLRIEPPEIDEGNLNELELRCFVDHALHFRPDRVYLDAPVHPRGIPKVRARLIRETGILDWIIEPKADATYPVVGAASIGAKVERDAAIAALGAVGSGYPSDPVTRDLLAKMLASGEPLPAWVRSRWGTIDALRQQNLFG